MNREELAYTMTVKAEQTGSGHIKVTGNREERRSVVEPYVGLEFDSAEEAQEFYNLYATQSGFKIRIGQLYRSRTDRSVTSRRFVCTKEGFQTKGRTGCPAFIRVHKNDTGKWILANINKEHNHELDLQSEISPHTQRNPQPVVRSAVPLSTRTGIRSFDSDDLSEAIDFKRLKRETMEGETSVEFRGEPYKGLEFSLTSEAYKFYNAYAANVGFTVRIGQLFRSKNDGLVTSRRFVCSKEGHQHPSRVGCPAFMKIQRQESGKWLVDRLEKDHNHEFESPTDATRRSAAPVASKEDAMSGLENMDLVETNGNFSLVRKRQKSNIGSDWYNVLLEYFQSRQAEDTGFFYAMEVDDGKFMNVFWADGRSRFSCSQFGDAIVFDTTYRRCSYTVPFASFVGINHHSQPVLLGCALIADESEESFTWVFQTWLRAMSGRNPLSIIADQDKAIQLSIAHVFPGTHHRFSADEIMVKEQENLGALLSVENEFEYEYGTYFSESKKETEFKHEYETCVSQSKSEIEFDSSWNMLLTKYNMKDNNWLKEMYNMRKSWVPFYIRGTFFAGIPLDGSLKPYFGRLLSAQTPLNEFIVRYEKCVEKRREEEKREDFNSFNIQVPLHTKDPIEEQCRRLYTLTMFKRFQKELLECYSYMGRKLHVDGVVSRYLLQKCGIGDESNTVAFNSSNFNINCSCKMFEFEGVLCRHALKVFQINKIRELPSRYILHRWSKNAKYGILRDIDSGGGIQDFKAMMLWSLREESSEYIEAGAASVEKHKLAFEMMQEGRRNLCWQT